MIKKKLAKLLRSKEVQSLFKTKNPLCLYLFSLSSEFNLQRQMKTNTKYYQLETTGMAQTTKNKSHDIYNRSVEALEPRTTRNINTQRLTSSPHKINVNSSNCFPISF